MKDRWIALYVENQVGVLAKISGLFAGKSYNLKSLTVGTTEEEDTSRITISTMCDDITFEQIKKQLIRWLPHRHARFPHSETVVLTVRSAHCFCAL